jgi:hypothetical protein
MSGFDFRQAQRNHDDGAHRGGAGAACWEVTAWRCAMEEPSKEIPDFK